MKLLAKDVRILMSFFTILTLVASVVLNSEMVSSAEDYSINNEDTSYKEVQDTAKTNVIMKNSGYYKLDIKPILQYPELPTGCEVTALTTVLNYYDCNVDKSYIAKNYLKQGEVGKTNPMNAFVGSPFSKGAYGCYSDAIVNAAESYISDYGLDLSVKNVSKLDFPQLLNYVKKGQPIIFWTTMHLEMPYESEEWTIDGEKVIWYACEHCMVLLGFDYDTNCYIVSDPLEGIAEYNSELMEVRYNQIGKQAVLVSKNGNKR